MRGVTGAAPQLSACHLCFRLTSTPNTALTRAGISRLWFVPSRFPSLFSSSSQLWTFPQEEESGLFTPSLLSLPKSPQAAPATWNSPSSGLLFLIGSPSLQIHLIPDQMTLAEPAGYISLPSRPLSFREKHWNCPCPRCRVKGTLAGSRTPAILINTNVLPSVKLSGDVFDYCCHHQRPQVGTPKTLQTLGLDCKNWWVVS